MNRRNWITWSSALLGGLALPGKAGARPAAMEELASAAASGDEALWRLVRGQFLLDPDWSYLNFGGLGACPFPVLNRLLEASRVEERAPSAGRSETEWDGVKDNLAGLLGRSCRREELALISGATEGVNTVINGLPLKRGDEVITSTHEHVAVNAGLLNRRKRDGIVIRRFRPDRERGAGNVERIAALVTRRTRLILLSHVTCTTGQLFPVAEIAALARARSLWFALDGAQGPVCVPMDISELGADFYVTSTHKWVMAPKRTGFLWVRPGRLDALHPASVGGYSAEKYDVEKDELTLAASAKRFEYGTQNEALFYALGAACDFIRAIGLERILRYNHALAEAFHSGLKEIPGVDILSPSEARYRSAMIGFRMETHDSKKIDAFLAERKIRVRQVSEGGLDSIRVSFHVCNHEGEVQKILDALKKLARA